MPMAPKRLSRRQLGQDASLPAAQRPNGALLLGHLSQYHPDQVGPYQERMCTEAIATVAAEALAVVEEEETR